MTWTYAVVGLILGAALVAWVLDRKGSRRADDAKIASSVVTRVSVAAVLVWAITLLVRTHDWFHLGVAAVVGLVAVTSLFLAVLGVAALIDRSNS
jgi:hypothetical protein